MRFSFHSFIKHFICISIQHVSYTISHSKNLYYRNLVKSNEFPSHKNIYKNFMNVITPEQLNEHIIYTCGSGVTACILAFCGYCIGAENFSIYDGSWSEWSQIN